tara:strand:+ start:1250 stop:1987 length:738 start_codon:yes stop_codon:yes gene_type:complete
MKFKKAFLNDLIQEVYYQEKENILEQIRIENKIELLNFLNEQIEEKKIRKIVREDIKSILFEKDVFKNIKKKDDEEEEEETEDDVFSQSMKSSASGEDIKVMTAYGDASHPDHDEAVKIVQQAKEKDPDLEIPEPGHAGKGSSGETSKGSDEEEPETGTVFKTDKPSYKGVDGEETEDPTDRPGYIYGDDEIKLPTFARDLPLYWKLKAHAGEEDEVMTASPVSTHVFKQKKRKRGPRKSPGGFR